MTSETKYFGPVEYEADDPLHFPTACSALRRKRSSSSSPSKAAGATCCASRASPTSLAFVAMNPFSLLPDYSPEPAAEELAFLGASHSGELGYYVLCAVREPVGDSTVNLKCPVVVNPETRTAVQVILEGGAYHMRHRLAEFRGEEAVAPC